jgi:hypothetical protein
MDADAEQLAERIREELGRRRVKRQWLADTAKISLSTLEKGLAGQRRFTTATLVRIEAALGIALRVRPRLSTAADAGIAPTELGAYSRAAVRWIERDYLTIRPSFGTPGALCAYRTAIAWDEDAAQLVFQESDRADSAYSQHGDVSLPNQSGQVYLVTRETGQFRLAILSRPTIAGAMSGLLTTLQAAGGSRLVPVSCPIALLPIAAGTSPRFGFFRAGEAGHEALAVALAAVEAEGFARLIGAPER